MTKLAFISVTNNKEMLEENLLKSRVFRENHYPLILQEGFRNVSRAYNEAMKKTGAEVVICLHQDVFLPDGWDGKLLGAMEGLKGVNWGVLGVAGVKLVDMKQVYIGHILDRGAEWGCGDNLPAPVDTLDELLLVMRNDGTLFFDERIPTAHFYGADICLQARETGRICLAIDAYCHHNSARSRFIDTPEFYGAMNYMRRKWQKRLPFATTCTIVD